MILRDNKGKPLYPQTTIDLVQGLQDQIDTLNNKIDQKYKTYIHQQVTPASIWNINHNLDKYPSVSVIDSTKSEEVICEIKYVDSNNLQCIFVGNVSGFAYIN